MDAVGDVGVASTKGVAASTLGLANRCTGGGLRSQAQSVNAAMTSGAQDDSGNIEARDAEARVLAAVVITGRPAKDQLSGPGCHRSSIRGTWDASKTERSW